MDATSPYSTRDQILELARLYETVACLELIPSPPTGHETPGSRVPPGVQCILDADETGRALMALADWAEFAIHVLVDERPSDLPESIPNETPARLRILAAVPHVLHFLDHDDFFLVASYHDEIDTHLRTLRRISSRGVKTVRTGRACRTLGCAGQYVSRIAPGDLDGTLECRKCGSTIDQDSWVKWPSDDQYVTVQHAANILQTSVTATRKRASRGQWRRKIREDGHVLYLVEDVNAAAGSVAVA